MQTRAADAVDQLLQTYSATGGINYLDAAANLPSRQAIEAVCAELMSLMFPGFRGEALVDSADLPDRSRGVGKPHLAVLTGGDPQRLSAPPQPVPQLRDLAGGGDPP